MRHLNDSRLRQDTLDFLRGWTLLLCRLNFEEACAQLDKPAPEGGVIIWDADLLISVLTDCNGGVLPVINNPHQMDPLGERIAFYIFDDGSGFGVDYTLPADGEWSDFVVRFTFEKLTHELYTVLLHDILIP